MITNPKLHRSNSLVRHGNVVHGTDWICGECPEDIWAANPHIPDHRAKKGN